MFSEPLISCICPTRARPHFVQQALACFLSQTWPNKELVILDDRDAPSFSTPPEHPEIRYELLAQRYQLGPKRNLCCSRAQGDLIAFMDDDDWYAPEHLETLAGLLIEQPWLQIVGYGSMEFRDLDTGESKFYDALDCMPDYAPGASLMFRKSWWRDHQFRVDASSGEDTEFINTARGIKDSQGRSIVMAIPANGLMWASKHRGNTSPREAWNSCSQFREMVTA